MLQYANIFQLVKELDIIWCASLHFAIFCCCC